VAVGLTQPFWTMLAGPVNRRRNRPIWSTLNPVQREPDRRVWGMRMPSGIHPKSRPGDGIGNPIERIGCFDRVVSGSAW